MISVDIQRAVEDDSIPNDDLLVGWAENALAEQSTPVEMVIRIVDTAESQQLNHDYRGKDAPTNVLSFPFEAPPELELPDIGDLVICAEIVKKEAQQQKKTLEAHWAHMITHGVLHLLGYDHIDDNEAEEMESLERGILAKVGFSDPYQLDEQDL